MDVKNAFLNGILAVEIYTRQPEGFVDEDKPNHIFRIDRPFYGLKRADRGWYQSFRDGLECAETTSLRTDPSTFFGKPDGAKTWIIVYVDVLLDISRSEQIIRNVILTLGEHFILYKDHESACELVGVAIINNPADGIRTLSQYKAIKRTLKKFNMSACKAISSQMERNVIALLRSKSAPVVDKPYC